MPFGACTPRSSRSISEEATSDLVSSEARISWGPAAAMTLPA
jgi:hypothetical protein